MRRSVFGVVVACCVGWLAAASAAWGRLAVRRAGASCRGTTARRRRRSSRSSRHVTTEGGPDFVPAAERIAVFDNDGTLWSEQPMYVQLAFALDRVQGAGARSIPSGRRTQPFKSRARRTT